MSLLICNMKTLQTQLQKIGLTSTQSAIFLALYQYGAKPASTIAKMIGGERTNIYKSLQTMVRQGRVAETKKWGTKHFFVADPDIIDHKLQEQARELQQKQQLLPAISLQLKQLRQSNISPIPPMQLYEGKQGIKQLFADLQHDILDNHFLLVKCFASNTLEAQSTSSYTLNHYAQEFFKNMTDHHVHIDGYVGGGVLLLEQLFHTGDMQEIKELPAGHEAVQLFLAWPYIYTIIFKDIPFGRKVEHQALADMFHFLLKMTKKK